MYEITSGIYTHFAHHVRGHSGPCISLHGHTWLLQVTVVASELDKQGFVVDFDVMQKEVFGPCHALLDHSLAIGEKTFGETREQLLQLGQTLVASRHETLGNLGERQAALEGQLEGAHNEFPGGIKVCVFPFSPTSERLAEWLYRLANQRLCYGSLADGRLKVTRARIYESLQPVESYADFTG
jgi:6-pyruvoyl-tetrahydropterin synthase